ncbi:MAG: hypothetical protein NVSMB19_03910 [Vulcanimicrobiaceae bacterium]
MSGPAAGTVTATLTVTVCALESTTVIVVVPEPSGSTVNVVLGPLPCAGETVATPGLLLVALSSPE